MNDSRIHTIRCLAIAAVTPLLLLSACDRRGARAPVEARMHADGTYRGVFIDRDRIEVNVQFTLRDGVVTAASFRHLRYDDHYHLHATQPPHRDVIRQHQDALDYLVGKHLETHLPDLHQPATIIPTEVDGHTAATIRGGKIISAIRDGLNRGVYSR